MLYFNITGIEPEEWSPILQMTARKDPKVGSFVSLDGFTDWQGRPVKLPLPDKMTGLFFTCGSCVLEEVLSIIHAFQRQHADKVQIVVVYIGQPSADFYQLVSSFKGLMFVGDPQLKVFERLNSLYMPRFYLIASDGTLQYLSPLTGYLWRSEKWQKELQRLAEKSGR